MTTLGLQGVTGRTGGAVLEAATDREDVTVAFGISRTDPDTGIRVYRPDERAAALEAHAPDVVVDFSEPAAAVALADVCADAGVPLVVGTTGFDDDQVATLRQASKRIPVLKSTNFARGVQALLAALGPALERLPGYDVELLETHHSGKRDAPSGTASTLLDRIAEYREFETVPGREGIQPRDTEEVGVLARRAGDIRGEHELMLAGNDESLTLTHRAEDRGVFAAGALDAATWLLGRDPGWYSFEEVVTADRA
jgi:4-hydroxy-tetrahydrodipicolinate reductase